MDGDSTKYISRENLINFPFPYKLWCAVNSGACDFIQWNIDGTQIKLQMIALEIYLNRPQSIFRVKSRSAFWRHLLEYGFKKVDSSQNVPSGSSAYSEMTIHFRHENFLRYRIDLLANLRKINNTGTLPGDIEVPMVNRKEVDPCFVSYGALSKICKARIRHQTILNYQFQMNNLKEKIRVSEMKSKEKGHMGDEEDSMIELPVELFENPHDSVLYMGDENRTTYAGFYGNCESKMIFDFFGDYLPMYENSNTDEGEKRVAELNSSERKTSQSNSCELSSLPNEELPTQSEKSTAIQPSSSSSLQPIFIPDEEKEEDISMDDFIKFKEQTSTPEEVQDAKIKSEVLNHEENEENEANFKNFFSQYRESLSLLYENH